LTLPQWDTLFRLKDREFSGKMVNPCTGTALRTAYEKAGS